MFGLRNFTDAQPRWKNGQPHHSTIGVAKANSIQLPMCGGHDMQPAAVMRNMEKATSGTPSTTLVQKRQVISRSSGFSSRSQSTVIGSSAMPQIGHAPGASRTISGCMGQVHCVFAGRAGISGSSAMPHLGHAPGRSCRISGSIGQT